MFRQDSLEANRQKDLERRFEMVMRMVRNETKGERPDVEKRAEQLFLTGRHNNSGIAANNHTKNTNQNNNQNPTTTSVQDNTNNSNFTVTNRDAIKSRKFKNLNGVDDGYYVVANVYKGGKYMNKFMDNLNEQGFSSDYVDNPKNGLKYVYLERYDSWKEAADAYKSNMDGKYNDALWIMNVDNRYTNEAYASNVDKLQQKSAKYDINKVEKNIAVKDHIVSKQPTTKTFKIDGAGSGYYIIANVFANPNNAKKFVKLLNSYGLSASYFINPENNWRYVYLKRHESWSNALISYYSKLNDAYDDKMWIMRVKSEAVA
jgi:hypothetical protein